MRKAMSLSYCVREQKPCVRWIENYFKDCICNIRDELSFGFGLISLVCWGAAEIPQIITNFRTKSSRGVSLAFLITWVIGDVFNLVGCLLEPATLPTQFFTAVLYAASTVILVLQGLYYDHIHRWLKCRQRKENQLYQVEDEKKPFRPKADDSGIPIPTAAPSLAPRREYYYTSARSLAGSGTPPFRTYLRAAKSGPSAMEFDIALSSDDEAAPVSAKCISQPRPIPRSAGYGAFLATSLASPLQTKALTLTQSFTFRSRRLLHGGGRSESTVFGQWLGWVMAAIYMGGRIPQIWLNIKRGSVEGLNPSMFIFALVANLTYMLSILVRTTEWHSIKPNMPWLLDAAVCVLLDLLILLQFVYYKYFRKTRDSDESGEYMDASKLGSS